jgi:lysylphosphatidylglycerol synthetase-like protein (DUF2156 family)
MNEVRPQSPSPSVDSVSPPSSESGQIFTALLISLGLLCMLVIGQFAAMLQNPNIAPEGRWVYHYIIWMHGVYLFAIVLALVVRGLVPSARRTITMAVSIFLLLYFPFGTMVGVYGLRKVDKAHS